MDNVITKMWYAAFQSQFERFRGVLNPSFIMEIAGMSCDDVKWLVASWATCWNAERALGEALFLSDFAPLMAGVTSEWGPEHAGMMLSASSKRLKVVLSRSFPPSTEEDGTVVFWIDVLPPEGENDQP